MALTLHIGNKRLSSWSLRPYLVLARSGLPFETNLVFLDRDDTPAKLAAVSPTKKVPVLVDGTTHVWESIAIAEYIHELAPAAKLWPDDRAARARARAIAAEMHSGFTELRSNMPMDLCASKPGVGHTPGAMADVARVQTIWHDALAASGGPFLFGHFTIADAMYAPVATRFATYGVAVDATSRAYMAALEAMPELQSWRADAAREPMV